MEEVYGVYEYGKWFVMLGIWSGRSRIVGKICSEGSLLISMSKVDTQDEQRRAK